MKPVFQKEYALRANDFDCYNNLLPSAILDLFQSAAGEHAILLGTGFEDMLKKQLIWVLVKVKYKILKSPKIYETVTVKTWPLPEDKITLQREFEISDANHNTLILGSTEWVTVDSVKRKLAPAKNVYNIEAEVLCKDKVFEEKFAKIPPPNTHDKSLSILPTYCDLDVNGHVNNTKYSNFVLNAVSPLENQHIFELQIDYHKEIKKDMPISIYTEKIKNVILAMGKNEFDEKMFSAKIVLE